MTLFRLGCFIIWTATLIYSTNGAPATKDSMLDKFLDTDFKECNVLDIIVLPEFKSDNDALDNPDGTYDLSVPLEICTTPRRKDNTAIPMCNEAFEVLRNLSTCREDTEALQKAIPGAFKPVSIAVQVDNVCEDFFQSRSILSGKKKSVAFKLVDKDICPMVCNGNVSKTCAFLLWGYKVQARINDALHQSASSEDVSVVQNAKFIHQTEEHNVDAKPQGQQPVDVSAGKTPKHTESGEHEIRSLVVTETPRNYQSPVNGYNPLESKPKKSEVLKNKLKEPSLSQVKSGEQEFLKPKLKESVLPNARSEEMAPPNTRSEELVPPYTRSEELGPPNTRAEELGPPNTRAEELPKVQSSEQKSVEKTDVTSTIVAGKFHTVSLEEAPKNGKTPYVRDGHNEVVSDEISKTATVASTADVKPHKVNIADAEGKLHSDEIKKTEDKPSDNTLDAVGNESKGEATLHSANTVPKKGDVERLGDSTNNENQNVDNPPSDTENNYQPDTPMKDISGKQQSPENSIHEKTGGSTTTKITNPASEDSASKAVPNASDDMGVGSQPVDGDDNFGFSVGLNDNSFSDISGTDADMESDGEKPDQQTSPDANKTPVEKINISFPEQEDTHFFFYFVTIVIFAIGGYVLFHNKQKIFALIIEGRHERRRRSGASYRKLETK